jgi:transcriptional repressor NrdR
MFVKKDGRREPFNSQKILSGIEKACQKRPISVETQEKIVQKIVNKFQESGEKEISFNDVGEMVIKELFDLDDVAYVRFASVYRSFKDVTEFMNEVKELIKSREQ